MATHVVILKRVGDLDASDEKRKWLPLDYPVVTFETSEPNKFSGKEVLTIDQYQGYEKARKMLFKHLNDLKASEKKKPWWRFW